MPFKTIPSFQGPFETNLYTNTLFFGPSMRRGHFLRPLGCAASLLVHSGTPTDSPFLPWPAGMPLLLQASAGSWARLSSRLVHVLYGLLLGRLYPRRLCPLRGMAAVFHAAFSEGSFPSCCDPSSQAEGPHKVFLFLRGIPSFLLGSVMQCAGRHQGLGRCLWFRQGKVW